jgi:hypothetical protein
MIINRFEVPDYRLALKYSEAMDILGCSYEQVILAVPKRWRETHAGTIPATAVYELAKQLGVPCNY